MPGSVDATPIVVALIGAIATIIAAILNKERRKTTRRKPDGAAPKGVSKWAVGMWVSILVAVISLGYLLFVIPRQPEVRITTPVLGATVGHTETVSGTSKNLPAKQVIWVAVYVRRRFYPQNSPATMYENGRWSSEMQIGRSASTDIGKRFDIVAVVADAKAKKQFEKYLEDGTTWSDWQGLEVLPEGAHEYDRISVTRR